MFRNIKIIYDREMLILSKKRIFALSFAFINVILALFVLIYINNMLIRSRVDGTIDYADLLFLHERIWDFVYLVSGLFVVFLSSMSINLDKKRWILDNILATRVNKNEIVFGKYISYVLSIMALAVSCMPICMISTFYGGISYIRMIFVLLLLFFEVCFLVALSIMFSSLFSQENVSLLISTIVVIFLFVLVFYFRNRIINNKNYYIVSILLSFVGTFICLVVTVKSKIFNL